MKHFLILTLLTLGLVAGVTAVSQKTQTKQQASQSINLNTRSEIDSTNNPDGTMGPKTAYDNFSNSLPNAYLGKIVINLAASGNSPQVTSLTLAISKAEVHLIYLFIPGTSNTTENINGQKTNQNVNKWETFQLDGNTDQPLVTKLKKGQSIPLGITPLAGGKYSEIRLYISKATAKLANGEEVELIIPQGDNIVRVVKTFNIFSNKTTYITLNLDDKNSLIQAGDTYFLQPVISRITASN